MVSLARIFLQKENKKHLEKKKRVPFEPFTFFFFAEFFSRQIFIVRDIALDVLFLVCHRIFETSGFDKNGLLRWTSFGDVFRRSRVVVCSQEKGANTVSGNATGKPQAGIISRYGRFAHALCGRARSEAVTRFT